MIKKKLPVVQNKDSELKWVRNENEMGKYNLHVMFTLFIYNTFCSLQDKPKKSLFHVQHVAMNVIFKRCVYHVSITLITYHISHLVYIGSRWGLTVMFSPS